MDFPIQRIQTPFRMQPGLSRLAPLAGHWTPLPPDSALFAEKLAILSDDAGAALLAVADADAWPALDTILADAGTQWPGAVAWDGLHLHLPALDLTLAPHGALLEAGPRADPAVTGLLRGLDGWQRAAAALALVLHEDWALLRADGQVTVLAVCTPSRWVPGDKLGLNFVQIHAPVADNRLIVGAADALVRLVTGGERWERHVWTVTPSSRYDQHPQRTPPPQWDLRADADALLHQAWLRVERQTFLPVRATGTEGPAAVFTIRVERAPLAAMLCSAADAHHLRDALASMTPAVLAYRGLAEVRDRLLNTLTRHAATLP